MNNKGQTLVIFVLIIPIILIVFSIVIDLGFLSIQKRHLSNSIKDGIKYGLRNIDNTNIKNEIEELLYQNIDKDDIKKIVIDIKDNYIKIDVLARTNSLFGFINLIQNDIYIPYVGHDINDKVVITKGD